MIKNFTPKPYEGLNSLPDYVRNKRSFTLEAKAAGGYVITLAKLTVGDSVSAGTPLSHAVFESFTDHGERRKAARSRVSGTDMEFVAARSAMAETGVEFYPSLPNSCETILYSLGEWFQVQNPEIEALAVVSQTCH